MNKLIKVMLVIAFTLVLISEFTMAGRSPKSTSTTRRASRGEAR